ncbi:hypothetical protein LC087_17360 [Bacillus carboniphilus]|uniref:Spore coat protein n=1 Tax=Bacillus carboniphilus TaxID=86663 RepID=A0ABY9JSS8_9BACI|nr:hypothetical protein [Bacillus carboniphilus]WLR42446.1 hypothetical protein LC087_17360 [Bacillus carboniphilus]
MNYYPNNPMMSPYQPNQQSNVSPNQMNQQANVSPYQSNQQANVSPQMTKKSESEIKQFCHDHHHHFVIFVTNEGQQVEGIIDELDDDSFSLLVPSGEDERFFGAPFYGYGYPRRFRYFRPYRFPYRGFGGFMYPFFI